MGVTDSLSLLLHWMDYTNKKMKNILITSAGKRVVLVQIFQDTLRELGMDIRVYTADMNPSMAPACIISDGFFKVPKCSEKSYIDMLLELCVKQRIGIIIPTIDTELLTLSLSRDRFEGIGVSVVISDSDFVHKCRDKRLTHSLFKALNINTPNLIEKHAPVFPMFAKPYDGSLSTNIHIIKSREQLTKEILGDSKLLFMDYISKEEYKEFSVDMYYGKDGYVKCIVPRERIEIRAGEINKGITRKNYIVGYLKQRMNHLEGVRGCICLQLFYREKDNDIKGIEINPRFGGGYPLTFYAKANFAQNIIEEYMMGEEIKYSESWLDNTLMLRYDKDVIVYDK